jgi:hypothetical protein
MNTVDRSRWLWRVAALVLCGLHAFVARHTMNPDGVSYLDIAGACARGDLAASLNPYWSPLYPWLLAGALAVVRPTPYWECAAVHGVNFLVFLGALLAFEWFLAEWLRDERERAGDGRGTPLPAWVPVGFAYALFLWTSRRLVTVSFVTPDMCVALFVYLAAALTLRTRRTGVRPGRSAALGVVLGLAYLAKAVMFPLGFVFLGVSALAAGRRAAAHLAAAGLSFGLIAGGFIAALSAARGYPTFGDSGRLNYAWYVAGVPRPHAPADPGGGGRPAHPPRRLLDRPAVYEFASPVAGTYPLWYDPAYWYEGVRPAAGLGQQAAAVGRSAAAFYSLLGEQLLGFTGALAALFLFTLFGRAEPWRRRLGTVFSLAVRQYPVLLPAAAAVGLYLLVGHVEGRLIGPFLVLLAAAVLGAVWAAPGQEQAAGHLARACLVVLGVLIGGNLLFDAANAAAALARGEGPGAHPDWQVARVLHEQGLRPGDGVGFVGFTFDAYWARLGGYRIVAEVPEGEAGRFWAAQPRVRATALESFRRAGARALVARHADGPGWRPVPGTDYAFLPLAGGGGEAVANLGGQEALPAP